LVALTDQEEREAAAENLLTAKGYEDCVVTITDDKVDVAVAAEELSDMNRAQIEDIVKRKTGVEADAIYITPIQEIETGEDTSTETSEETGE
jgi:stage III sporulation protein AH